MERQIMKIKTKIADLRVHKLHLSGTHLLRLIDSKVDVGIRFKQSVPAHHKGIAAVMLQAALELFGMSEINT